MSKEMTLQNAKPALPKERPVRRDVPEVPSIPVPERKPTPIEEPVKVPAKVTRVPLYIRH